MRKLFYLMIFIFPITTSFSLISINIWWKETKNLGLLLKPQSIMTNNKWGLNSLRGYDDGLMSSIRSNVMLGLQNNLGLNIVKNLRVDIYYGHVDDSNFYNAKTINFTDFTNTNYIFWFTVGIFATVKSEFYGHSFLQFDYRPIWNFINNQFIKFDNSKGQIDSEDKLVDSWNKLLSNQVIFNNFNKQFQKMGLDISAGMELQPGQMKLNKDISFFIKLSNKFISEKDNMLTINNDLFKYIPERLQASLFKLPGETFTMNTAATIKITSKDFKNYNFDYAILNKNVTLNNTLGSLYDDIKLFVIKAIDTIYHYNLAMCVFELQFRKNGYSDPNLLEKETTLDKLYIFSSGGKKKHWV
ncbi:hypothetical protein [Spiroplasma endosymbiont of Ammophila pubescens]|uniref:hypothetical protein n=1 Tax=Spiroplasma endosymbiont of Ammophila pubescens TaxID=3066315 RepID=UPI0032B26A8A